MYYLHGLLNGNESKCSLLPIDPGHSPVKQSNHKYIMDYPSLEVASKKILDHNIFRFIMVPPYIQDSFKSLQNTIITLPIFLFPQQYCSSKKDYISLVILAPLQVPNLEALTTKDIKPIESVQRWVTKFIH